LAVMYYVHFALSLRKVEDIMHERGIDICHETVRYWWNRFGPKWRWHLDEVFVKINGEQFYLWRGLYAGLDSTMTRFSGTSSI
jgi:putative transposase